METNRHHAFTSVQVPIEIWFNRKLSPADKILLTEIVNLTKANKTCFKSNQGFSDILGVSKDRVTRMLSSLKDRGFINIAMEYKPNSKQIIRRTISPSESLRKELLGGLALHTEVDAHPNGENADTLSVKTPIGIVENTDTPIGENTEDNIVNKNKSINTPPIPPKGGNSDLTFDVFWNLYDKKVDRDKSEKKWGKLHANDKRAIISYLPEYVKATPDKQYRKNPTTFLNNRSWENELPQSPISKKPVGQDDYLARLPEDRRQAYLMAKLHGA